MDDLANCDPRPWRLIIADDHPLFRSALRGVVCEHPDLEVVAEAVDGLDALELCRRLEPDLVLMDVSMPVMGGVEATRAIKEELPRTSVLVVTASEDLDHLAEALQAGAAGYVLKTAPPKQITGAVCRALKGQSPLNQEIAKHLLLRLLDEREQYQPSNTASESSRAEEAPVGSALLESLTLRETEVLRLLAQGNTNRQIARSLFVSESTVKKHVHRVISKLGASDRVQAAVVAIQLGVIRKHDE